MDETKMWKVFLYISNIFLSEAVLHGRNLIWTQRPSLSYGVARIVGIEGDPNVWVNNGKLQVRPISAPSRLWHFRDLAYLHANQTLFWSESGYKRIQGLILNATKKTDVIFMGTSSEVDGLAVDWISGNLYWTDALYNWIIMIPLISKSTDKYKIVTKTGLDKPHGIALLPKKGYLFWSDWGIQPKIEISDLTGQNRRVLVDTQLSQPRGLVVDPEENKIYWVDNSKDTIESIEFNGNGRQVIVSAPGTDFFGIALFEKFLFVTEQNQGQLKIYDKLRKSTYVTYQLGHVPYGIVMYDETMQPGNADACINQGCEHICVHDPLLGPTCHCGDGYKLEDNQRNCKVVSQFLQPYHIYSIQEAICYFPGNLADMSLLNITLDNQCFLKEKSGYMALAMDTGSNTLYFSSNTSKQINRVKMETHATVQNVVGGIGIVQGISLDWVNSNLYWTDSLFKSISVSRKDGMYQRKLLVENLQNPLGIAVYPQKGKLFWTDPGRNPKIEMSYLDGSFREVLIDEHLGFPAHLYIDFQDEKIYWGDSKLNHVRCYSFKTETFFTVFSTDHETIFGISLFQDYLLWTDNTDEKNGLHIARRDNEEKVRGIMHPDVGNATDVITFDAMNQPSYSSPCSDGSSGCHHMCLSSADSGHWCECGLGYQKGPDGRSCTTEVLLDNFLLVVDGSRKQIFQINTVNANIQAIDVRPPYRPMAVDYDPAKERVYWTDIAAKVIKKSNIDGKLETLVKILHKKSVADGIAVDSINKLIFYTDAGMNCIGAMTLTDRPIHKIIIGEKLDEPRGIAASSLEGRLYWTDWGSTPQIETSAMDGSDRRSLVHLNKGAWPNGMAIDHKENRLYWVDAKYNKIETINTQGADYRIIYSENKAHYFGITLLGDHLFITDWSRKTIMRIKKTGGQLEPFGAPSFVHMNGICAYNSSERLYGISVCFNATCSHLCLPTSRGRSVCACPDGLMLARDRHTCISEPTTTAASSSSTDDGYSYFTYNNANSNTRSDFTKIRTGKFTSKTPGSNTVVTQSRTGYILTTTRPDIGIKRKPQYETRQKLSKGAIATIVVFALIAPLVVVGLAIFFYKRWKNSKNPHHRLEEDNHVNAFYRITFPDVSKEELEGMDPGIHNRIYDEHSKDAI